MAQNPDLINNNNDEPSKNNAFTTKTYYRYYAFGLEIESQIILPELLPSEKQKAAEVLIEYGNVPETIPDALFKGVRFQAAPGKLLLKVDNVANYLVSNGNKITIAPFKNAKDTDIRLFLLGSAFGALFHQQELLPIHGSAIVYNNQAVIFSGTSGSGKSTLAASFLKKGYRILSDDICIVSHLHQKPIVFPSYPHMKLWADTLEKMGETKTTLKTVREGIQKYSIPYLDSFHNEPMTLAGIFIITTKNTPGIKLSPVKGIEKFNAIKNNTYRLSFLKGTGTTEEHFQYIGSIAQNCFVTYIERPNKGFHLNELTEQIEENLKKIPGNKK